MAFQKIRYIADLRNAFQPAGVVTIRIPEHFFKILSYSLLYEETLGILWQHREIPSEQFSRLVLFHTFPVYQHLSSVRAAYIAYGF